MLHTMHVAEAQKFDQTPRINTSRTNTGSFGGATILRSPGLRGRTIQPPSSVPDEQHDVALHPLPPPSLVGNTQHPKRSLSLKWNKTSSKTHKPTASTDAELKFGIAADIPPPHIPLRKRASSSLRLRRKPSRTLTDSLLPSNEPEHFLPEELVQKARSMSTRASNENLSLARHPSRNGSTFNYFDSPKQSPTTSYTLIPGSAHTDLSPQNASTFATLSSTNTLSSSASTPDYPLRKESTSNKTKVPSDHSPILQDRISLPSDHSPSIKPVNTHLNHESLLSSTATTSTALEYNETERSSVFTTRSSATQYTSSHHSWAKPSEDDFSIDDCISMYAAGFGDDSAEAGVPLQDTKPQKSSPLRTWRENDETTSVVSTPPQGQDGFYDDSSHFQYSAPYQAPNTPTRSPKLLTQSYTASPPIYDTHEHKSTQHSPQKTFLSLSVSDAASPLLEPVPTLFGRSGVVTVRTSAQIMAGDIAPATPGSQPTTPRFDDSRDRYGFKKASNNVSMVHYDEWNHVYSQYLSRRRSKWNDLMRQHDMTTDMPAQFPPRSDKIKRFVRKGVPPEWRGNAWFFYAGGPAQLERNPGLYHELAKQGDRGLNSDIDREHIERDLHRSFPDNIFFKPDPSAIVPAEGSCFSYSSSMLLNVTTDSSGQVETPMIRSLRRVLRAFAIYYPKIGYCQSLNFLAGLLLLFLAQDEEKAFHMLCILTTEHLPGTHGVALEGANVDISVLMGQLKEQMPALWSKLDDRLTDTQTPMTPKFSFGQSKDDIRQARGMPTISLATTAWFMSCFVGTLPIESACRVWDVLFYEGSKTLFRVALGIFKLGENDMRRKNEAMEIFQIVQNLPRQLIDANGLMEASFGGKSLEGRGLVSSGTVKKRRQERRELERAKTSPEIPQTSILPDIPNDEEKKPLGRVASMKRLTRMKSLKSKRNAS